MLRYIFYFCAYGNQCCANLCKRRVTFKIGNVIFDTLVTEDISKKRFVNSEKSFMVFFAFVEEIIQLALTANGKKKQGLSEFALFPNGYFREARLERDSILESVKFSGKEM